MVFELVRCDTVYIGVPTEVKKVPDLIYEEPIAVPTDVPTTGTGVERARKFVSLQVDVATATPPITGRPSASESTGSEDLCMVCAPGTEEPRVEPYTVRPNDTQGDTDKLGRTGWTSVGAVPVPLGCSTSVTLWSSKVLAPD